MYRALSNQEIEQLGLQGCTAEQWKNVLVKDSFQVDCLQNVRFSGKIELGSNKGNTETGEGIAKSSGIYNCFIRNCAIGDNVYLANIGTLANYRIDNHVAIENVGTLMVNGTTTFGNGHEINILNEGGGRELPIFDKLSAQLAYLIVVYRHNKKLTDKLKAIVAEYVKTCENKLGVIGANSIVQHSKTILNVNIGPFSKIRGASHLEEGTLSGNQSAPVTIGEDVSARNFIVLSGSKIESGTILSSTFIGQGVETGKHFSAENSAFFANCEGFHGEVCSVFAGPYTVTHHKSTLLIAGLFSFYNAGSGTNQSNHMYKLGPIHQGIVERGSKTGSFSYMLWPCRVGAFSVIMDKHAGNFDTTELPFSYITVENGKSVLTPAMNLFTVGTARDNKKWPSRDRRKDPIKLDQIHFDFLNPFTAGKMLDGVNLLTRLHENTPKSREFASYKGIHINRLMLRTSKRYYELALMVFISGMLVDLLKNKSFNTIAEIQKILSPAQEAKLNKWVDLAGLLTEKERIDNFCDAIVSGRVSTIEGIQNEFQKIHEEYEQKAWKWCVALLKKWKSTDVSDLKKEDLLRLLDEWKNSSVKFNNMILKDAEKEFDQLSRIGFGPDEDDSQKKADFENIRGDYETNKFISGIREKTTEIEKIYDKLLSQLNSIE